MKRIITKMFCVFCAVVLCVLGLAACNSETPTVGRDGTYYLYENDEYDKNEYMVLNGDECKFVGVLGDMELNVKGSVAFDDAAVTAELAVKRGDTEIKIMLRGDSETGVLHFTDFMVYLNGVKTFSESDSVYYCKDGFKPSAVLPPPSDERDGDNDGDDEGEDDIPEVRKYTVRFVCDGVPGATVYPVEKIYREGDKLEYPRPEGYDSEVYAFCGWFDGNRPLYSDTPVTSDFTATAKWRLIEDIDGYNAGLYDYGERGHLYVHYYRYDHDDAEEGVEGGVAPQYNEKINSDVYGDWGLWVWSDYGNGRLFNAMKIDKSGAVFDIDLNAVYDDGGWDSVNNKPSNESVSYGYESTDVINFRFVKIDSMNNAYWTSDGGNFHIKLGDYEYFWKYHVFRPENTDILTERWFAF